MRLLQISFLRLLELADFRFSFRRLAAPELLLRNRCRSSHIATTRLHSQFGSINVHVDHPTLVTLSGPSTRTTSPAPTSSTPGVGTAVGATLRDTVTGIVPESVG